MELDQIPDSWDLGAQNDTPGSNPHPSLTHPNL